MRSGSGWCNRARFMVEQLGLEMLNAAIVAWITSGWRGCCVTRAQQVSLVMCLEQPTTRLLRGTISH